MLELRDVPAPEPGPGQLLVDVEAIGVNYRDVYEREGRYGGTPPFIAGTEGAGRAGDEAVAWWNVPGSYADQVVVDADRTFPVPDGISSELAAAALLQGMTAHYLATSTYPVQEGDNVLVHAAAGGVGLLLTQIVKLRGGRVVATTSSEEKAELARVAGADEVIGYDDVAERANEFAVVYDGVGKATFDWSLAAVRPRGMLVLYGAASGPVPPFDPMRLESEGSLFLTRPTLRHYSSRERAAEVFGWIKEGRLEVRIGGRYPLEQARNAHEDLEARRTTGKLLLLPQ